MLAGALPSGAGTVGSGGAAGGGRPDPRGPGPRLGLERRGRGADYGPGPRRRGGTRQHRHERRPAQQRRRSRYETNLVSVRCCLQAELLVQVCQLPTTALNSLPACSVGSGTLQLLTRSPTHLLTRLHASSIILVQNPFVLWSIIRRHVRVNETSVALMQSAPRTHGNVASCSAHTTACCTRPPTTSSPVSRSPPEQSYMSTG